MSVTQLVRSTQLKQGLPHRVLVNDADGKMVDLAAITAAKVLLSDASGLPTASSTTPTTLSYLDVSGSVDTLLGEKLSLSGGTLSGNLLMDTRKITGMVDPSDPQDAATMSYVDGFAAGLLVHAACHVATTEPLAAVTPDGSGVGKTLTFDAMGVISVDTHELVLTDRILVKNQVDPIDNGIYNVTTAGAAAAYCVLTRATDLDGSPASEVTTGDFTFIQLGTQNKSTSWSITSGAGIIAVDVDPMVWAQFSAGGSYTAGNGIAIDGTQIKLANIGDGYIFVGNGSSEATGVAMSGEATIINTGAVTLSTTAVVGKVLASYPDGIAGDPVAATDTIQQALTKLWEHDSQKLPLAGGRLYSGTGTPLEIQAASPQLILGVTGSSTAISAPAGVGAVLTIPLLASDGNFLISGEDQIVAADINASAGIAIGQFETMGGAGDMLVGSAGSVPSVTAVGGSASINALGEITISGSYMKTSRLITKEVPTGDIDGSNRSFTLANSPTPLSECVFVNGVLQKEGATADYTMTGTTSEIVMFNELIPATASGTITYGSPTDGSTIIFSPTWPTQGPDPIVYTKVSTPAPNGGNEFVDLTELLGVVKMNGLPGMTATQDAGVITMVVAAGEEYNGITVTGTGSYSALNITFSGAVTTVAPASGSSVIVSYSVLAV